jgi:hypothetical protein
MRLASSGGCRGGNANPNEGRRTLTPRRQGLESAVSSRGLSPLEKWGRRRAVREDRWVIDTDKRVLGQEFVENDGRVVNTDANPKCRLPGGIGARRSRRIWIGCERSGGARESGLAGIEAFRLAVPGWLAGWGHCDKLNQRADALTEHLHLLQLPPRNKIRDQNTNSTLAIIASAPNAIPSDFGTSWPWSQQSTPES